MSFKSQSDRLKGNKGKLDIRVPLVKDNIGVNVWCANNVIDDYYKTKLNKLST